MHRRVSSTLVGPEIAEASTSSRTPSDIAPNSRIASKTPPGPETQAVDFPPRKLVRWRDISKNWREALSEDATATKWGNVHLTPKTLYRLFHPQGGVVRLYEGQLKGRTTLFYDWRTVKRAIKCMVKSGVSESFFKDSFNRSWLVDADIVVAVRPVSFSSPDKLVKHLAKIQEPETAGQSPLQRSEGDIARSVGIASAESLATVVPPACNHLVAAVKRSADAADYPTPPSSIESTPEPSTSDVAQAAKKFRVSEAAEAKLALRAQTAARELKAARAVWESAREEGGATFLSIDVETWERDHACLLEVGWSMIEFNKGSDGDVTTRLEHQHAIIKDHIKKRNGRFSPDARDHFDFGESVVLPLTTVFNLLYALFTTLSTSSRLFLVFHDPRADLRALYDLGFDPAVLQYRLGTAPLRSEGIYVVDTQSLYSAWAEEPRQTKLSACCVALDIPTKRLHNAANDAVYTRLLLEAMMDTPKARAASS